ncbi:MAG TPA: hypothetical protein VGO06_27895 [Bosea sp. (in: a-proteobacteria)]|jgi:hypothetical protein|uniref:hypothetical protein n=1 Tax=Bosea sp. (in: a-proteobacteria) TaxID=1871050 RepID=UPI002E0DE97A|nr:hypothetical protein [Bosea sp. (in: a-proteobacteria)]
MIDMPEKPVVEIPVVSVSKITVSGDPNEGALVRLETEADADLDLVLSPAALAQLEALLARARKNRRSISPGSDPSEHLSHAACRQSEILDSRSKRSHFVRMTIVPPLTVSRFRNDQGEVVCVIIRDASGRAVHINCDPSEFRRTASRVWSPEDAEALAKWIARRLSEEIAIATRVDENRRDAKWCR